MKDPLLRFYLVQALECSLYCLMMIAFGSGLLWLWSYDPAQQPELSLLACGAVALFTGRRAGVMFRCFHSRRASTLARLARERRVAIFREKIAIGMDWRYRARFGEIGVTRDA